MLLKKLGRYTQKKKLRYGATFCSLGVRTRRCLASYMAATVQTAQFFSLLPDRTFKRRENRTTKWDGSTDIDGRHSAAGRPLVFLFFIVQSPNSSDHPYWLKRKKQGKKILPRSTCAHAQELHVERGTIFFPCFFI